MKQEAAIPIILGFLAMQLPRWLAEEDTPEGHIENLEKNVSNHVSVMEKVLVENEHGKPVSSKKR